MKPQINGIFWGATTVAVIVLVTRWLLGEGRGEEPRILQDSRIYGVRSRVQIAGFGAAGVFAFFAIAFHHEFTGQAGLWLIMIPIGMVVLGIWLAAASVITTDHGITKKTLFGSRSVDWKKISGVRLYEKQRYIEVYTGNENFSIDLRFVAQGTLLDEILRQSKVQLERK